MVFETLHKIQISLPVSGRGICACLALLTACSVANAQSFLDDLRSDKNGQGHVTVTESKEIDELVNGKAPSVATPTTTTLTPVTVEQTPQAQQQSQVPQASSDANNSATPQNTPVTPTSPSRPSTSVGETEVNETIVDTRKKVMRNSYKTTGYRIQVYSGGNSRLDRQKAETAGAVMKSNFPNEPIYVHFYSPSWKCRMGNYRSIDEARRLLAKVKKLGYPQANIIKGTISVQY